VVDTFNTEQIKQAAILANHWGWHSNAIRTIAKVEYWNDLEIRFPTPYQPHVMHTANQLSLEPAWIYGVIRRESAFMPDARSSTGATGLMQLMQGTARGVAKRNNLLRPSVRDLMQGERNIQLGSTYLRQLLNRFDNHQVMATAAYNAGPHRVMRWLPTKGALPADQWIDTIPFTETRRYVRSVIAYTAIFERMLNEKPTQLKHRMLPVEIRQKTARSET
jgi:soluble lytic murein transglycosylase